MCFHDDPLLGEGMGEIIDVQSAFMVAVRDLERLVSSASVSLDLRVNSGVRQMFRHQASSFYTTQDLKAR
jgi:hypothetical protein